MRLITWILEGSLAFAALGSTAIGQSIPVSGRNVPEMAVLDQAMTTIMARYSVPGAQLAITRNGKLLFARGYGYADAETKTQVQPDSLFRIASVTKSLTTFAVLKLAEEGKINLEAKAFTYLPDLKPLPGATVDPRLSNITVRMLLNHSGGWDRDISFDPANRFLDAANAAGVPIPGSPETLIRYMLGQKLDHDPGTIYAYSNFGYLVLGRIVERTSGMTFEQYVRTKILAPAGIDKMRVGQTVIEGRLPGEVTYYAPPGLAPGLNHFTFGPHLLPIPYGGGFYLEGFDSSGGWVANSIDLARLYNAVDGRRGTRLLTTDSIRQMTLKPNLPQYASTAAWYGMGFNIRAAGTDFNWWHGGGLIGTIAWVVRRADGYVWCALFNYAPSLAKDSSQMQSEIDGMINTAIGQVAVANLPTFDQFTTYPDAAGGEAAVTAKDGVVHGGTFQRGIVSGSWLTVFGANLAATTRIWTGADIVGGALPQSLDGTSVKINGKPAFVFYISPLQINVQAPGDDTTGWVKVEVTRNGKTSSPVLADLRVNAPGFLKYPADGRQFVVAVHTDGTIVGDTDKVPGTRYASPGLRLLLFGTAFAPSQSGVSAPAPLSLTGATVRLGTALATVEGCALISPGLFQTNIVVPQLPDGDYDVTVEINGQRSPAGMIIPVRN